MATTKIQFIYRTGPDQILTDLTSVVISTGVIRTDTSAEVVPAGTELSRVSTGIYEYDFEDPDLNLTYEYTLEWTYLGITSSGNFTIEGNAEEDDVLFGWDEIMAIMVRSLINDLTTPYRYSDAKIQQSIVVGGLIASQEYSFPTSYTFDLNGPSISPDPTATETYDAVAIALFTLKAACMLSVNDFQAAVGTGIKVRDGDSSVDTTGSFSGYKDILNMGPCAAYKDLLKKSIVKASGRSGKAILGPYGTRRYGELCGGFGNRDCNRFWNNYFG